MNKSKVILESKLCVGCGVCKSLYKKNVDLFLNSEGKYEVEVKGNVELGKVCPVLHPGYISDNIWGDYLNVYFGWSKNKEIRKLSSSGGVITQILVSLLENKDVDCVLQIGRDCTDPMKNSYYLNKTKEDVLKCAGSRYAPASLLREITNILDNNKSIALVGKPCDIRAINNLENLYPELCQSIKYKISFFCGGVPSGAACEKVIKKLGVINREEVDKFDFRGNGWPGLATAYLKDGTVRTMTYSESWGNILGRDIHTYCKFCIDGVGQCSDISCGDGWYGTDKGYPSHEEGDGRNVIISRTRKGEELLKLLENNNELLLQEIDNAEEELRLMQPGQYYRKTTLFPKVLAMKMIGKKMPCYDLHQLRNWSLAHNKWDIFKVAAGTIKRVIRGKI